MLRTISFLGALLIAGALVTPSLADEPKKECCGEGNPHAAQLGRLVDLVGEWTSADQDGDGKADVTVTYRLTGGGSALVETLNPGTPQEMVSVYHRDGEGWVLTHYCAAGNQPRMRGTPAAGSKAAFEIAFAFTDGTNLKAEVGHMAAMRLTLVDASHLKHEWTFQGPKEKQVVAFELTKRA
jgi:hypothetical protein